MSRTHTAHWARCAKYRGIDIAGTQALGIKEAIGRTLAIDIEYPDCPDLVIEAGREVTQDMADELIDIGMDYVVICTTH